MTFLVTMRLPAALLTMSLAVITIHAEELKVIEDGRAITVTRGKTPVLTYHKAEVDPPEGVEPIYKRSGFIHPLCAPSENP